MKLFLWSIGIEGSGNHLASTCKIIRISFGWELLKFSHLNAKFWSYIQLFLGKFKAASWKTHLSKDWKYFSNIVWDDWIIIWLYISTLSCCTDVVPHCSQEFNCLKSSTFNADFQILWMMKMFKPSLWSNCVNLSFKYHNFLRTYFWRILLKFWWLFGFIVTPSIICKILSFILGDPSLWMTKELK